MSKFFEELAKKLAERWLSLLLLPGAAFVLLAVVGVRIGHGRAFALGEFATVSTQVRDAVAHQQVLLLVAVLLAAAGTGLVVQALAGVTRLVWLGQWPRLFRPLRQWLVRRRRARWHGFLSRRRELEREYPAGSRTPDQQEEVNSAAGRLTRTAPAEPGRPTWMGDRVHAVEQVALNRYGLDLAFGWSRLWLVLPETVRAEITAAEAGFAAAVATGTWAWPYLALGVLWWPAFLIAVGIGVTGWVRARAAMGDVSAFSEAAIDLHGRTLAVALGVGGDGATGPLTVAEGREITAIVRKGR